MENYLLLFVDTFCANLFITSTREMANNAMIAFGYDKFFVMIVTVFASLSACCANYFFGILLFNIYQYSTDQKLKDTYEKWQSDFKKYKLKYLALCNILPGIGNVIGLICGFLRMNISNFILFVLFSRIIYYYCLLL